MYEWAQDLLTSRGYVGYEISNWARPGLESRHNLTYWRNLPYLGVGPGAHSYLGGCRFAHCTQPADYINRVAQWADRGAVPGEGEDAAAFGAIPTVAAVETIDRQTEMAETLMMGLRLEEGVTFAGFADRFGLGLLEVYPGVVDDITSLGIGRGHRRRRRLSTSSHASWATPGQPGVLSFRGARALVVQLSKDR